MRRSICSEKERPPQLFHFWKGPLGFLSSGGNLCPVYSTWGFVCQALFWRRYLAVCLEERPPQLFHFWKGPLGFLSSGGNLWYCPVYSTLSFACQALFWRRYLAACLKERPPRLFHCRKEPRGSCHQGGNLCPVYSIRGVACRGSVQVSSLKGQSVPSKSGMTRRIKPSNRGTVNAVAP